jgi:hypothetical protein
VSIDDCILSANPQHTPFQRTTDFNILAIQPQIRPARLQPLPTLFLRNSPLFSLSYVHPQRIVATPTAGGGSSA